jgi:hypothetical protein
MLGFRYREVLHGGYYLLSSPVEERAADLSLDVEVHDVSRFTQSRTARLRGTIKLEGLADDARVSGKMVVSPDQRRVAYELRFGGNDAARYRLRGYKQLEALNLVDSFTLIRGSLYDAEARETGRAMLRFDARGNWKALLRSVRVRLW